VTEQPEACDHLRMETRAGTGSAATSGSGGVTRRGLILFGLMALIWGIPYLFIRVAVAEISPATLVFGRTGIAALILVPIALTRTDYRAVLARWRWVVAFAVIEMGVPWVLLGSAEQQIPSSLAGLLVAGVPLVATVLAVATGGRDRIGSSGLVGLLIGLVGVAAVVGINVGSSNVAAIAAMGVVVVGYAVGPAILARRLGGLSTVAVMALSLSLCAIVYAPVAFVQRPAAIPSPAALAAVVVLGVVCTAAAFLLFWALIDVVGPVRATVVTYLNPAVAALLGVLVLNESFTPAMGVGFLLVILGSVLATRPPGSRIPWRLGRSGDRTAGEQTELAA
jgi:drug/metabolite transporter (DMT)-like permease